MIRSKSRTLESSEGAITIGDFLGFVEPFTTIIIRGSCFIGGDNISSSDFGLPVNTESVAVNTGITGSRERTLHFDYRDNPAENLYINAHQGNQDVTVIAW